MVDINKNGGSLIGVFNSYEEAEDWITRMLPAFSDDLIYEIEITPINGTVNRFRAGIVYRKAQLEFEFMKNA